MNQCLHKVCGKEKMIWLPVMELNSSSVEKHLWCENCGLIKNISDDRPYRLGYWMNLLGLISNCFNLSQCQKRLIAKEIESSDCLNDTFGSYGHSQKIIFKNIIKKYVKFNIDSLIC